MGERPSTSVNGGGPLYPHAAGKEQHRMAGSNLMAALYHNAADFSNAKTVHARSPDLAKGQDALTFSRMVHFTLFGIPVYIRPTFWVVLAIFGNVLGIQSAQDLINTALFVIAGFIAILSHEMGHALVGRKLGGGQQTVLLELFGGLTSSHGMQLTRWGRVMMILAGPLMTLLLGVLSLWIVWQAIEPVMLANGLNIWHLIFHPFIASVISQKLYILSCLIMIGEWWTILNLLPIYPLDGGQLVAQFVRSPKKVFMTGIVTAIVVGLASFQLFHGFFIPVFMAIFAYSNYREYKNAPF